MMKKKQPLMATAANEAYNAAAVGASGFTDAVYTMGSGLVQVGEMGWNGLTTVGGVVADVMTSEIHEDEALREARGYVESCSLNDGSEAMMPVPLARKYPTAVEPLPPLPPEAPRPQEALPLAAAAAARRKQQQQRQHLANGCQGASTEGCLACTSGLKSSVQWALSSARGLWRRLVFGELQQPIDTPKLSRQVTDDEVELEDASERSRIKMQQHQDTADWSPTVLLYDASQDPPPEMPCDRRKLRRAYYMPLNGAQPALIENENFSGSFLFLHRAVEADRNGNAAKESPYQWHFAKKTRRWEARVQGRFLNLPKGELFTGCVLEDFDYSLPQSWSASMLAYAVVPLMEAVMGETFYFSWGERGKAAEQADAELATIVTWLSGVDQVIVTPADETPPEISSDITNMGLRRNTMSGASYHREVQQVVREIDTEKTYTFCVWGCSRYIDVFNSAFDGVMGLGSISYAGFLDEWPAHFVLYSVEGATVEDPRHLERRKRYFVDVMVWSSQMALPKLPSRYNFCDQRFARSACLGQHESANTRAATATEDHWA